MSGVQPLIPGSADTSGARSAFSTFVESEQAERVSRKQPDVAPETTRAQLREDVAAASQTEARLTREDTREPRALFDGEVHRSAQGGLQSKTPGGFFMIPGKAWRLYRRALENTPFVVGSFDQHFAAGVEFLIDVLEDHDSYLSLGRSIMHFAIALQQREWPASRAQRSPGYFGLVRVAQVMEIGAEKYGVGNWRDIEYWSEIDHAVQHVIAFELGDESAYKEAYAKRYGYVGDKALCNVWNVLTRLCFAAEVFDETMRFTSSTGPDSYPAPACGTAGGIPMPKPWSEMAPALRSAVAREGILDGI